MNRADYTEDHLVEQPAIQHFTELGWTAVAAMEEVFGADGTLGRETKGEVVQAPRLREMLERLNAALLPKAITAAIDTIARDLLPRFLSGADVAGGIGLE